MEPIVPPSPEREPTIFYAVAGLLPVVVGAALVAVRDETATANLALIMVLAVVLAAAIGGRGPGVFAAVVSAMSFDFFLTEPYLSLKIDRASDIETTLILLVIGLAVGQIAVRARRAHRAARRGSNEIERLHRVAELAAGGAPPDEVLKTVQEELIDVLQLKGCEFNTSASYGWYPVMERSGALSGVNVRYFLGREFALPEQGVELPVLGRGRELGRFILDPDPTVGVSLEDRIVAVALSDQLGAVLAATDVP